MDQHMQGLVARIEAATVKGQAERREFWEKLSKAQAPGVLTICCSDSRAAPEHIAAADPGQLFVARSVAGLVPTPPGSSEKIWLRAYGAITRQLGLRDLAGAWYGPWAAIEFPVFQLAVPNILLLGHSGCGGIALARRPRGEEAGLPDTDAWVDMVRPVARQAMARAEREGADAVLASERAALLWSARNLLRHQGLAGRVRAGLTRIYTGHYDIASGDVTLWNARTGAFDKIAARPPGICVDPAGECVIACRCAKRLDAALAAIA